MPTVGKGKNRKIYQYNPAGERAARKDARRRGLQVEYTESTYERMAKLIFEIRRKK